MHPILVILLIALFCSVCWMIREWWDDRAARADLELAAGMAKYIDKLNGESMRADALKIKNQMAREEYLKMADELIATRELVEKEKAQIAELEKLQTGG